MPKRTQPGDVTRPSDHMVFRPRAFPFGSTRLRMTQNRCLGPFHGGCAEEQSPRGTKCFSTSSTFFFCLHARFSSVFDAVVKFKIKLFCRDLRRFPRKKFFSKIYFQILFKSIFNFLLSQTSESPTNCSRESREIGSFVNLQTRIILKT